MLFCAAVRAAVMTLAVVVMAAHYKRIIAETAVEKGIHSIVRIAVSAAVKLFSVLCLGFILC